MRKSYRCGRAPSNRFTARRRDRNTIPPLPACGLGLLDAIPPMGSKFNAPEAVSPAGARNIMTGDYQGAVSFYFGDLPAASPLVK